MTFDKNYWTKVSKRIIYLILAIIAIYLSFRLAVFYMPFLIAFVISLIIEPTIKKIMKKFKLSRRTSSIIIFIIVFTIIIGTLVWGITTLVAEATNLLQGINDYFDKAYIKIQEIIGRLDFQKISLSDEIMSIIGDTTNTFINTSSAWAKKVLTNIVNIVTSIPQIAIYVVITILSLYFICTDKIYMLDQLEHHLPESWVKNIGKHLRELIHTLGGYLKAQAILILVSFIISIIGLYILKFCKLNVQYPLLMAVFIGFVDALPILGSGTVMIPWAVCLAINGDLKLSISIIVLWIIMSVIRQIIEPKIVSNKIGIHPIFTLIAMYTGFRFIGVIGMLIGPIVLIILKNIFSTLLDKGVVKTILDTK